MTKDNYIENIRRNIKKLNNNDFEILQRVINSLYKKNELIDKKKEDEI